MADLTIEHWLLLRFSTIIRDEQSFNDTTIITEQDAIQIGLWAEDYINAVVLPASAITVTANLVI